MYQAQYEATLRGVNQFFDRINRVQQAWHGFFERGEDPPPGLLHPYIGQAWRKGRELGLDPHRICRKVILEEELLARKKRNRLLIDATAPFFNTFVEQMQGRVSTLDLYDRDLAFIKTFGSEGGGATNNRRYATPGFQCTEETSGITAMSMARATGRVSQLIGPEHLDASLHEKICTSVPIFGSSGKLAGIINLVETLNPDALKTASTLAAISQGVEYNLKQMKKQQELESANLYNGAILESVSETLLATDARGRILMLNPEARRLLGNGESIVGRTVEECFGEGNPFSQVLFYGNPISDTEIPLLVGGKPLHMIGTIRPIRAGSSTIGVIGTFNGIESTQKVLRNIGGWKATMTFADIIGSSRAISDAIELARQTADLQSNTLLLGESGTGKEVFAQAIHNGGSFSRGPFVAVNCAAIPNSLLESELFGYEGGAYTGAKKGGQPGKFELARGGTLFLDEINSMPLDMQAKLLRVLQEKTVTRVGGVAQISLDLKIIAASNVPLQEAVLQGKFRSDLFYRLNVIMIRIPPLRERLEDLPELAAHFLGRLACARPQSAGRLSLSGGALRLLRGYGWPGNVRELENILERAYVQSKLSNSDEIDERQLAAFPEFCQGQPPAGDGVPPPERAARGARPQSVRDAEKEAILNALGQNRWNISKTARLLGLSRNTLYRKLRQFEGQG